jgi:hypothetical protein
MGSIVALASIISISAALGAAMLLAWYSIRQAARNDVKTWLDLRARGFAQFRFATEKHSDEGLDGVNVSDKVTSVPASPRRRPRRRRRRSVDGGGRRS